MVRTASMISTLVARFKASSPGRGDVAENGAEDGRGVGGSFIT
jgi:hypothetical protein